MYCEILQHRHTERKLESVNTGDASTHWSILQLSRCSRYNKRMQ